MDPNGDTAALPPPPPALPKGVVPTKMKRPEAPLAYLPFQRQARCLFQYSVAITYKDDAKGVGRKILDKVHQTCASELEGKDFAHDGLFTIGAMPQNKLEFDDSFINRITTAGGSSPQKIPLRSIAAALTGKETENFRETVGTILRQHPAKQGCLLVHSSVQATQGGLSLNIDVSTTIIFQPGPVIGFLLQNQNVKDPFQIDWVKRAALLEKSRQKPIERMKTLNNALSVSSYNAERLLTSSGISISNNLTAVEGRVMFEDIMRRLPGPPQLLLCILPERKNSDIYGPWKKKNLSDVGIQCIALTHINDQCITNDLLKINAENWILYGANEGDMDEEYEIQGWRPAGLVNLGNSCFYNTALQVLLSLNHMRVRVFQVLTNILAYNGTHCEEEVYQLLSNILAYTGTHCEEHKTMFHKLQGNIRVSYAFPINGGGFPREVIQEFLYRMRLDDCDWVWNTFSANGVVFTCPKCHQEAKVRYNYIIDLISKHPTIQSIQQLLLSCKLNCNRCELVSKSAMIRFSALPKVLMFEVKTLNGFSIANSHHLDVMPHLAIENYVGPTTYRLKAIVRYKKNIFGIGHCFVNALRRGRWYEINDNIVMIKSDTFIDGIECEQTLLAYEMTDDETEMDRMSDVDETRMFQ